MRMLSSTQAVAERFFASLDEAELALVERTVAAAERHRLERVAALATRLGNGWLYPILTVVVVLARIESPLRSLFASAMSLAIAFLVYPPLKRFLARTRPCDYEPSLVRAPEPLDRYSCPSGHAITAAAYAVPFAFATAAALPLVLMLCAVIGWSRVALGHHYVSDVILGAMFGATVAGAVGAIVF